jgi:beta-N-acetylhexosaminidase
MGLGPLIVDIAGTELTGEDKNLLVHPLVGGVILFSRNYISKNQIKDLILQIKGLPRKISLLICVDQEGGRIQRFKKNFTQLPSLQNIGDCWKTSDSRSISLSLQKAFDSAKTLAFELREVGVDFSFTPVLDINWGRSDVIGDRSISSDPYIVSSIASSIINGLMSQGMKNCGKHFPGHGWAKADSHFDKVVDKRKLIQLNKTDLVPYQMLARSKLLNSVMPAHVIYPEIDSNPAGFSKIWLQEILRKQIKFDGLIISDDLSMKATELYGSILDRVQISLESGCDAILLCNDRKSVIQVLNEYISSFDKLKTKVNIKNLQVLKPFFDTCEG